MSRRLGVNSIIATTWWGVQIGGLGFRVATQLSMLIRWLCRVPSLLRGVSPPAHICEEVPSPPTKLPLLG